MLSVVAALLVAAGVCLWPRATAAARVSPPRRSPMWRWAVAAQARLTRHRHAQRRERETVAVARALAAELRAGAAEASALAAVATSLAASGASLAPVLVPAAAAVARGATVPAELLRVAGEPGARRLAPVAAAWTVATRHGSPMTALLDRLADAYDEEDAARADLAASVAGTRASMLLLAALPLAGLMLGASLGAHPWSWLLGRPAGWMVCVLAAALDAAGLAWTRRLLSARS